MDAITLMHSETDRWQDILSGLDDVSCQVTLELSHSLSYSQHRVSQDASANFVLTAFYGLFI